MNITNRLRAGYPGIYITTHEEQRAEAMLLATAKDLKAKIFGWTVTHGRFDIVSGDTFDEDQLAVLDIEKLEEKTILVLKDYHLILNEPNAPLYRKLKEALFHAKTANKWIIIIAPVLVLPVDLQKLFCVMDLPLPDKDQIKEVLENVCKGNDKKMPKGDDLVAVLDACRGLTINEAEDAIALSIVETGKPDAIVISKAKTEMIGKNGIVEIIEGNVTLDDIGGLDIAKSWLVKRRNAFGEDAVTFRLPTPKGMLVTGIHGTGKSLIAKAAGAAFGGLPILKLDCGAIFGKHVGESEGNMRGVIAISEAIAPCILWIDELEKGFGRAGEGDNDGGTKDRVIGSLLQWMNDKTAPVFIVATANEVSKLDPALVRKGRFDEIFYVDLPNTVERFAIWKIQVRKHGREESLFNEGEYKQLVDLTDGCTGAEIESLFIDSLYEGFDNGMREPNLLDVAHLMKDFKPLSILMAEDVKKLRAWTKGRARAASTPIAELKTTRKLAA